MADEAGKVGILSMTHTLAVELVAAREGIKAIDPGPTQTALIHPDPARRAACRRPMAIQRDADPAEIAAVAAFLRSAEASFVTGETIHVDGGCHAAGMRSAIGTMARLPGS